MNRQPLYLLIGSLLIYIWSMIDANNYFAWFMLSLPSVLMMIIYTWTYKRFRFTNFSYWMIFLHLVIMLIGAKYTYTLNPLFDYLKQAFDLSRNHYDRIGHMAQGFFPVFLVKEFLLRKGYMTRSKMFYLILFAFILAVSAAWELLEFIATLIINKSPDYVISSQGDPWDSQWDMLLALLSSIVAILTFGKMHDKHLDQLKNNSQ